MEYITGYDSWKTALPAEPDPLYKCDNCDEGIYDGDGMWEVDGSIYCDKCAAELYRRLA